MTKPFWPLAVNTWDDAERDAAHRVIDSGALTMGEETAAFEREFAAYIGSRHAVMVNSGSSANLLAVAAMRMLLGLPLNHLHDAVVPAIAWSTTYAPLAQHGFHLRVVDVDPQTLNTTADAVRAAVTEHTRLLVGVSILGNPAPVDALRELVENINMYFIEDNCESMGAKIGDKFCGTFGHIGTFSTFFSHHMSTGEGGILVTDDDEIHEIAVCLRAHGWTRNLPEGSPLRGRPEEPGDYQFVLPGYSVRPTEIAAAVGRVQLRRLGAMNAVRLANWVAFYDAFRDDPRWQIQRFRVNGSNPVPFGFTLVFRSPIEREEVAQKLRAAGIEYRMITGGCFSEHAAAGHYRWDSVGPLTAAKHAHHCGLFVGNHPFDLSNQIDKLAEVLK